MKTIRILSFVLVLATSMLTPAAIASTGSKILATGGSMSLEGAAGGGIVPWALIAGYAEQGEWGGSAWLTQVRPDDFQLNAFGAAASLGNRLEVSVGRHEFDIDGVSAGEHLEQDIIGFKLRLGGELIYSRLPQISFGVQHKRNTNYGIPSAVGSVDDSGTDFYLAASKLMLDGPFHRSLFINTTVRATKSNQLGLLGFGGDRDDQYQPVVELSAGLFLNRKLVFGAEYRQKPDNLGFARESDWYDVFVGWFPSKRVSVVAAWSDLGSIAGFDDQKGLFLSLQVSQ